MAGIELVVTHVLVALWRTGLAVVLSALSLPTLVWLGIVIRSFRRLPVLIEADRLVVRTGTLMRVDVPREQVASLCARWDGRTFRARGARKLSLLAYPNVAVVIDPPIAGRRGPIGLVGHRLDDLGASAAALEFKSPAGAPCEGDRAVLHAPPVAARCAMNDDRPCLYPASTPSPTWRRRNGAASVTLV